jgi:hypothetical protein
MNDAEFELWSDILFSCSASGNTTVLSHAWLAASGRVMLLIWGRPIAKQGQHDARWSIDAL